MKADTNINIRTTNELKTNANEVLHEIGLDISTAVNIFLTQVVIKRDIPFELAAPPQKIISLLVVGKEKFGYQRISMSL